MITEDSFTLIVKTLLPKVKEKTLTKYQFARCTMLYLGDVTTIPSGLISEKLIKTHKPTNRKYRTSNVTHEHYKTRTETCNQICDEYLSGNLTEERLKYLIYEGRKVHFVTSQENIDLCVFQQDEKYSTWQEQYKAAGINLVDDVETFGTKIYWYKIEGEIFADRSEVIDKYSCSASTISNRCKSEKFPDWERFKYNDEQFK